MTNEEKAKEMANCQNCIEIAKNCPNVIICNPDKMPCDRYKSLLVMAQWKDEQMIDKAVEWLNDWLTDDSCQCGIPITKTGRENFLNDFKQSMKEK